MELSSIAITERTRTRLANFLIGAFVLVLPILLFKDIPPKNEQIITYMLGQLSGAALLVLGFYFVNNVGRDQLDAAKSENTGKALDAIAAVAATTPPDSTTDAAQAADQVADAAQSEADKIKGA